METATLDIHCGACGATLTGGAESKFDGRETIKVCRIDECGYPFRRNFPTLWRWYERVSARPVTFKGNLITVDDRWQYEFDIAFRHTVTKDVKWLKLTRVADGEFVEWTFQ